MKFKTIFFFKPKFNNKLKYSHAQLPTAIVLNKVVRVFYAMRDKDQKSNIFYSDFRIDNNLKIKEVHTSKKPILIVGKEGSCDSDGVIPSSIIKSGSKYYLYFIGWNKGKERPLFHSSICLAVSRDCRKFKKLFDSPIFQRNQNDPYLVTSPNINKEKYGYTMFYTSGSFWRKINGVYESKYNLKIAKSKNKFNWSTSKKFLLNFRKNEKNIGHPFYFKINSKKFLFYSYGDPYNKNLNKIGVALWNEKRSKWVRNDKKIFIKDNYNDTSQSKSYPYLLKLKKNILMFYNGNNFGEKGFCISVLNQNEK